MKHTDGKHDVGEEGPEKSVSHGDKPSTAWLTDWLIDDPVAILTD